MGSKRTKVQRPPSSDSSSSSSSEEEEEQAAAPPPAKKPSLKSTSPKTKPSKTPQPPSSDDEEDEDDDPPVSQKKDQKKKEVAVKKDEKKNEEEEGSSDEEESSSDEEEEKKQEEEEDNDEGSGTSDDEKQQLSKKPDSMAMSASGSDSDSDSDSEPSEKPAAAGIVTPAASGTKRPRDSAPSELENTEKKKLFQRFWGADDEIKILKGIIAFYSDKGAEPRSNAFSAADLDAIHSLLKKSLGLEFSKVQLGTKIRGIRKKFLTNASRYKNTDPMFSTPHQQEIYELSKKIWRPENPNEARKSSGKSVKSKGKSLALKVPKDQEEVDIPEGDSCYEFMGRAVAQAGHGDISWSLIKRGLKLVDPEKARPLEKRFRELELARMRHRLQWLEKREEATQLIIDSITKSG